MYINPYENLIKSEGFWLKANFHLHAGTKADPYDIGELVSMYKQFGYDILTVSNQHIFTDTGEYGKTHGITMINGINICVKEA